MNDRLRKFEAALQKKEPGLTLEALAEALHVNLPTLEAHITEGAKLGAMAESVLAGMMGCSLDEFIAPGEEETSKPAPARAESDLDQLLARARRILEGGGDKAAALRTILKAF